MILTATRTKDVILFGPFSLIPSERLLARDGAPVELSARALDILVVLLTHHNEVVSKRELLAQVWPDVTVEEGSLRFHVANLRRVLGDGKEGARYISTLAGRGYCFVAPISRPHHPETLSDAVAAGFRYANLPGRLIRMVGRDDDILALSDRLIAARFVSIVGAGGVGKTTAAVALGHRLSETFAGAVLFVDLGMLSDPKLVGAAVASMLGLSVQSDDPAVSLIAFLQDKRLLLILDTCEHLIESAASLASRIFEAAPQVHILATSREALRVESEHIYKLDSLACPPDDVGITADVAKGFPAIQLFVERAIASGARLDFDDAEAAVVAGICRRLDGVALAIELAARRVESYGLQQTAALLDQRLTLLWLGPRTAPSRQKTLQATLDWSYGLLTALEREVLRRLAIFVGHFTLDAALAVVPSATLDQSLVLGAIDSLVSKSMVANRPFGAMMRYRLLDTTRSYVLERRGDRNGDLELATRHASYFRQWLEQGGSGWTTSTTGTDRALYFAALNNIRAALEWSFGTDGNVEIGIRLAVAAMPAFLAISLLPECHRWSEQALLALDDAARGRLDEMHLQAAKGVSLMFTRGGRDAAGTALMRSFTIAEQHGDELDRLRLLGPLNMFHLRTGDFNTALSYATRCAADAASAEDPVDAALARCILGISLHLTGDLAGARTALEAALHGEPRSQRTTTIYLGFDSASLAGAILARTLWLQGHPDLAAERARQTVRGAAAMDHALTLSISLVWAISVFLWNGDLQSAEQHIDWLISRSESHSLAPYLAVGTGFKGELAIRRGDAKSGVEALQDSMQKLHAMPYELLTTQLEIALIDGLTAIGRSAEGFALVEDTIQRVERDGDALYMPELLRMKGRLLLSMTQPGVDGAEACFIRSLELSHDQGARAWQLRAAFDLATLYTDRGRREAARTSLRPVLEQFEGGAETSDVKAARQLLAALN
jgi:predicted ATPase/DNA-binding winged helix-turn-helix (wHTH) protein